MLFHQRDEIRRRVTRQRGLRKVRIPGDKILWPAMQIREITSPPAANQNFLAHALAVFQYRHAPSAFPSLNRAKQSGGTGSDYDGVEFMFRGWHQT